MEPLKFGTIRKGNVIFQASIFRWYVGFQGCKTFWLTNTRKWFVWQMTWNAIVWLPSLKGSQRFFLVKINDNQWVENEPFLLSKKPIFRCYCWWKKSCTAYQLVPSTVATVCQFWGVSSPVQKIPPEKTKLKKKGTLFEFVHIERMKRCTKTWWWFQVFVIFTPKIGEDSILTNIFQMGWSTSN